MRYRGTRKGFQLGADRKAAPTGGRGDPTLVIIPKKRRHKKPKPKPTDPLWRLREWEDNNGGRF